MGMICIVISIINEAHIRDGRNDDADDDNVDTFVTTIPTDYKIIKSRVSVNHRKGSEKHTLGKDEMQPRGLTLAIENRQLN